MRIAYSDKRNKKDIVHSYSFCTKKESLLDDHVEFYCKNANVATKEIVKEVFVEWDVFHKFFQYYLNMV